MKHYYLDASIALHAALPDGDPRARQWLNELADRGDELLSSTLLELEVIRVLRREGESVDLAGPVLDRTSLVSIDDGVLRFAGTIEPHVGSLDAIHVASCALLGSNVVLVTHDRQMMSAATGLGLETFDPLA